MLSWTISISEFVKNKTLLQKFKGFLLFLKHGRDTAALTR